MKSCQCQGCSNKKVFEPRQDKNDLVKLLLIILGCVIIFYIAYEVSEFQCKMTHFNPNVILGIPALSSKAKIKVAYNRKRSFVHPDKKIGSEHLARLNKAYQTLTDTKSHENWENHGDPDGLEDINVGVALAFWIVDLTENSVWFLAAYILAFTVGTRWYILKISDEDNIFDATKKMFFVAIHRNCNIPWKRFIRILSAINEFNRTFNSKIIKHFKSDDKELDAVIKKLQIVEESNLDRHLFSSQAVKNQALLYAHLRRIPLNSIILQKNQGYIVAKSPYLIQEQVDCMKQLIKLSQTETIKRSPTLKSMENAMNLCPMIVQGLKNAKSPLKQLPHINDNHIFKFFKLRKKNVKSLQKLAGMKAKERRLIFKSLSDEEYNDVMKVLGDMPFVDFQVNFEVMDAKKATKVTAGAIVPVTVTLVRNDMRSLFGDDNVDDCDVTETSRDGADDPAEDSDAAETDTDCSSDEDCSENDEKVDSADWRNIKLWLNRQVNEKVFGNEPKPSHSVHCPLFPLDKQEYWWIYICDRKSKRILSPPSFITNLVDRETCQLKFTAPSQVGVYTISVCLKSDSYIGLEQEKDVKLHVKRDINDSDEESDSDTWRSVSDSDNTSDED